MDVAERALRNHIAFPRTYTPRIPGAVLKEGRYAALATPGPGCHLDIFAPPLPPGADAAAARAEVREMLDQAREIAPGQSIGCRATRDAEDQRWVAAAALGRGMQWGWKSRWMVRALDPKEEWAAPEGITIRELDDIPAKMEPEIPFVDEQWRKILRHAIGAGPDGEIVVLGAFDGEGTLVGSVTVNVSGTDSGLWCLGVSEAYRGKGIGLALSRAALTAGAQRGATEMTLNATDDGARSYSACGFQDSSTGQTWWFTPEHAPTPTAQQIALAEAIVDDKADLPPSDGSILPCRLTPLRLAARVRSQTAARTLADRGEMDLLSAWELGWKDEAGKCARSGKIDELDHEHDAAPLHVAVMQDDEELARLLLSAGASKDVKDAKYESTPLGWAKVLGKPKMEKLLMEE